MIVLCGGQGTRIRSELGDKLPGVLADVNGRPLLAHVLDQVLKLRPRTVILAVGWRGSRVRNAIGKFWRSTPVEYSQEARPLGTAGALREALSRIEKDRSVLVTYGNSFVDAEGPACTWTTFLKNATAKVVLGASEVSDAAKLTRLVTNASGRVIGFPRPTPGRAHVFAGTFCLSYATAQKVQGRDDVDIELDLFSALMNDEMFAYRLPGPFYSAATPLGLARTRQYLLNPIYLG